MQSTVYVGFRCYFQESVSWLLISTAPALRGINQMSETAGNIARYIGNVDRLVHEPARLMILTILTSVKEADFIYLQHETQLSKGNLSSHMSKLEAAEYIEVEKTYRGKIPLTLCRITEKGKKAFHEYCMQMKNFTETL